MKLVEALVGFFVLIVILMGGLNFLFMNNLKYDNYMESLSKNSIKLSIYNYADNFISTINDSQTGYIFIDGYSINKGLTGNYYYECTKKTGNLLMSNQIYTGIFCTINIFDEKIFKYKLIP